MRQRELRIDRRDRRARRQDPLAVDLNPLAPGAHRHQIARLVRRQNASRYIVGDQWMLLFSPPGARGMVASLEYRILLLTEVNERPQLGAPQARPEREERIQLPHLQQPAAEQIDEDRRT